MNAGVYIGIAVLIAAIVDPFVFGHWVKKGK